MIREIIQYYSQNSSYVLSLISEHFLISFYGVLFASIVAIPLGIFISINKRLSDNILRVLIIIQTVPALAMLSLLIVIVGLGVNTVIVAIFLYSLLPILNNTIVGINQVDPHIIDASKGMGMSNMQVIMNVKLPLSMHMIIAGVKNAFVMAIGITAVGTFIGAGGLGDIISRGLNVANGSLIIWAGALPTALMAIVVDLLFQIFEKLYNKQ